MLLLLHPKRLQALSERDELYTLRGTVQIDAVAGRSLEIRANRRSTRHLVG